METVTSKDGTSIAYERIGQGPGLVLVGGAFMTRQSWGPHAQALAAEFDVVSYDRRGRGDSTDTQPYAVERELEDLAAVVEAVGAPYVHGMSSGAALALLAAASGVPMRRVSGMEPPYRVEGAPPVDESYGRILDSLIAERRFDDVVVHFMTKAVGQPAEAVAQVRATPMWPGLVALAPTLAYDNAVIGNSEPPAALSRIPVPALVLSSAGSAPWFHASATAAAAAIPDGRHLQRDGGFHDLPPETLAAVLAEFFKG